MRINTREALCEADCGERPPEHSPVCGELFTRQHDGARVACQRPQGHANAHHWEGAAPGTTSGTSETPSPSETASAGGSRGARGGVR